jgi:integrase
MSDTAARSGTKQLLTHPGGRDAARSFVSFTKLGQESWYKQSALKPSNSTVVTNRKMAQRFVRWLIAQNYAVSTQERYFRIAKSLCQYIDTMPLSAVTPMDIGDYLTRNLPHRWSDDFIADHLCALRCFFDFLYLGGVVDRVAPRFLKARARVTKLPRTLTQSQIKKLIRAAENPRDCALLELLYATGCRVGEIRVIRVEDIDFRARMFRVRGKSELSILASRQLGRFVCTSQAERAGTCFRTSSVNRRATSLITRKHGSATGVTTARAKLAARNAASGWGIPRRSPTPRHSESSGRSSPESTWFVTNLIAL